MEKNQKFIIGGIVILVVLVLIYFGTKKMTVRSKEGYDNIFLAKDYAKGNWVSRPNFKADLSPRFDSTRSGGGYITGSFPGMEVQGSPLTPVQSIINIATPQYATMGGPNGAYADPRMPEGGLSTDQVGNVMNQKFGGGRKGVEPVAAMESDLEAKPLLPVTDMRQDMGRDPSDPSTYMYDRYITAQMKRRNPNVNSCFIRGDLPVTQIRTGWFDVSPVAKQDLVAGYFSSYLDLQQSTEIRDSLFERSPTPFEQNNAWGRLEEKTIYSLV